MSEEAGAPAPTSGDFRRAAAPRGTREAGPAHRRARRGDQGLAEEARAARVRPLRRPARRHLHPRPGADRLPGAEDRPGAGDAAPAAAAGHRLETRRRGPEHAVPRAAGRAGAEQLAGVSRARATGSPAAAGRRRSRCSSFRPGWIGAPAARGRHRRRSRPRSSRECRRTPRPTAPARPAARRRRRRPTSRPRTGGPRRRAASPADRGRRRTGLGGRRRCPGELGAFAGRCDAMPSGVIQLRATARRGSRSPTVAANR